MSFSIFYEKPYSRAQSREICQNKNLTCDPSSHL